VAAGVDRFFYEVLVDFPGTVSEISFARPPRAAADFRVSPEEEMMSFSSKDLMIDVLPVGKFNVFAQPGLGMCAQGTATGLDEEDDDDLEEEDDLLECAQGTANPPTSATRSGINLALLQRQLRETLAL
jgi:hypothetical protein